MSCRCKFPVRWFVLPWLDGYSAVLKFWHGDGDGKDQSEIIVTVFSIGLKKMPYNLPQKSPNINDILAFVVLQMVHWDDSVS